MNSWRFIVMILALSTTLMLSAAEPPASHATPATPATPVTPATAAKPPTAAKPATPAADAGAKTEEPDQYESTEKVRADFEVSFPVDI